MSIIDHIRKKEFLFNCKDICKTNKNWLLISYNNKNGHETYWSIRIKRAVLKRAGMIK